ncbi:MAG: restriction endonuclease subunit S, partial [Chloroflexota bacterium]
MKLNSCAEYTPSSWETTKIKFIASRIGSGKTPKGGSDVYTNNGVMFIRSQNVHFSGLKLDDVVFIHENIDAEMKSTRVQDSDILLNITGASLGRCSIVPPDFPPANVNQHVCIIRPLTEKTIPRFLYYVIMSHSVQTQIFNSQVGSSREGLNFSEVKDLEFLLPSLNKQSEIADYLDRETAKIDNLITAMEQLLTLLAAKRQAVISEAVTRGLGADVPLRVSGVEWLGEIPAHWAIPPVYARYDVQLGKMLDTKRIVGTN